LLIRQTNAAADHAYVTRTAAVLVSAVLAVAIALGATASPAHSTSRTTWCDQNADKLPTHSLAAALICPASRTVPARHESKSSALNRQIAFAINQFRRAHGLKPLKVSVQLNASSRQHSKEMGADGYFDHDSADGTVWWKRIQHYYPMKGYTYWSAGENLLFASPDIGADEAMKQWIASPEHLANLKNPKWRNLGVSAVHVADAGGVYGGETVTIITTDFGARH